MKELDAKWSGMWQQSTGAAATAAEDMRRLAAAIAEASAAAAAAAARQGASLVDIVAPLQDRLARLERQVTRPRRLRMRHVTLSDANERQITS